MKLFSTRMHGVLDFLTAGTLLTLPRALGWSEGVTRLLTNMALGTVGYSLLTKYEWGLVKVLPMKGHLLLDGISGASLLAAPLLFPDEDSSTTGALVALGLWELAASLTTETTPSFDERLSQVGESFGGTVHEVTDRLRERALGA